MCGAAGDVMRDPNRRLQIAWLMWKVGIRSHGILVMVKHGTHIQIQRKEIHVMEFITWRDS